MHNFQLKFSEELEDVRPGNGCIYLLKPSCTQVALLY